MTATMDPTAQKPAATPAAAPSAKPGKAKKRPAKHGDIVPATGGGAAAAAKRPRKALTGAKAEAVAAASTPVSAEQASALKKTKESLLKVRKTLPVYEHRESIVDAVRKHAVVVVVGETGSGKTTQIPQFLHSAGVCKSVAVTQPRRISAISLAQRVAQEQGVQLGTRVGYSVRFDDMTSNETKIRFLTDGMLLRELLVDPMLYKYDAIVLDEAHERSVRTDVLLGMVRRILAVRKDLKVVVMSATLESGLFTNFFQGAHLLHIPGRLHEIRVFHTIASNTDYVDATLRTIHDIYHNQAPGDILAFMNGQEDIEAAAAQLTEHAKAMPNLVVAPLFANLPMSMQRSVFDPAPAGHRKVVLATNIAETSVTISGVRYVVDNGLAKIKVYHAKVGLESLMVAPISKSAALQRAGRAGREAPGRVYRLYTEDAFAGLDPNTPAEIKRANLANVVLQLKASGVEDVLGFDFIERPLQESLVAAHQQLVLLGALEKATRALTSTGRSMARYPLDPAVARVLVAAEAEGVTVDLLSLLALLSQETVFYTPSGDARDDALEQRRKFISSDGDLVTWLNALRAYEEVQGDDKWCHAHYINQRNVRQVLSIRNQLADQVRGTATTLSTRTAPTEDLLRCYLRGYFGQVAFLQPDGRYATLAGRHAVSIHPSSVLFGKKIPVVSFVELVGGESGRWFIRGVSRVDQEWVKEASAAVLGEARRAASSATASAAKTTATVAARG
ncbi:Salivary acidic proline-rich phosphoprotein 1/2 [Blastocladiella emersonii ATCC 22665]|nr:Salivary acidic proline-rich phosphoprotein 1/2 [Blastocladiella emersonii ATCC 22665]